MILPCSTTHLILPPKRFSSVMATSLALLPTVPNSLIPTKQPTRRLAPKIPILQVQLGLPRRSSLTWIPILTKHLPGRRSLAYGMSKGRYRARQRTQARVNTRRHNRTTAFRTQRVRTIGEAAAARVRRAVGVAEATLTGTLGGGSKVRLRVWVSLVLDDLLAVTDGK